MQFLTIKRKISLLRKRLKQLSVKINYIIKMRTKTKTQPAVQHKALAAKRNKKINVLKYYNNKNKNSSKMAKAKNRNTFSNKTSSWDMVQCWKRLWCNAQSQPRLQQSTRYTKWLIIDKFSCANTRRLVLKILHFHACECQFKLLTAP